MKALAQLRKEQHLSISSIQTYIRCPTQFFYRYILRVRENHRAGALAFGTAIHAALAYFYLALMEQKEITADELTCRFAEEWKKEFSGELPVLLDNKDTFDSLQDKGVGMLQCFHEEATRPYRVVGVEEPFALEICHPSSKEPTGERLVGVFDAVIQEKNGTYGILEHKTAARRFPQTRLDHDLQVTGYHYAGRYMGLGKATVTLQVLLKTSKPALELYQPTRTSRDITDFQRVAAGVLAAIEAGAFYPVREWWCQTCSHSARCVAG